MRRKLLLFAVQFVPAIAVTLLLYSHVLPLYQTLVVGGASGILGWLDPPMRMEMSDSGGWTAYLLNEDGTESFYWSRPGLYLNLTFLSLALLPALLAATPVPLKRRLRILGIGMVLLLVSHVLAGVGLVRAVYCLNNTPDHAVCTWMRTVVNTYGQLMSFVLWGLLTWDVWLPRIEPPAAAEREPEASA